jgi:lipopolysaccharide export LptBFGC system permease protein LptF
MTQLKAEFTFRLRLWAKVALWVLAFFALFLSLFMSVEKVETKISPIINKICEKGLVLKP